MQHGKGTAVIAAAGLAAAMLWSEAEAAEAQIRGFSFECETPDGQAVKPVHGDIEGEIYTNLPVQREQCLGAIDRKLALCRENARFASAAPVRVRALITSRSSARSAGWRTLPRPRRVCFEFRAGNAYEVESVDYHRG